MEATNVGSVVRLLLGVARLGESDLHGWWGTKIYSRAGQYVLGRTFPRTWQPAGGELLILSAVRWHEHIFDGRPTALHLYSDRLPFLGWTTSWLAEQKTTKPQDELFDQVLGWSTGAEADIVLRERLGPASPRPEKVAGHSRLGELTGDDLASPERVQQAAHELVASYLFSGESLSVPYFDLVR